MTQLRQSLRLILAAIITLSLSEYFHYPESYWMVISALLALHVSSNPLLRHKDFFLLSVALLAGAMAASSSLIMPYVFGLAIYLLVTTFCTVNVGLWWPAFWAAAFVANLLTNISSGFGVDMQQTLQRFLFIVAGFFIAIILQILFFPNRLRNDCKLVLTQCLQQLSELNQAIFDCYLAADYPDKQFQYEKRLHQKRRDVSYEISIARQLIGKMKKSEKLSLLPVFCSIEQIYEIILSMGLLDYRIEDRSTFELAYKEFLEIANHIDAQLRAIKIQLLKNKSSAINSETLKEAIYQFEDISRATFDVAAKDPMVFLLFIQDMYALNECMEKLSLDVVLSAGGKAHE
jgi:hypothetical protein